MYFMANYKKCTHQCSASLTTQPPSQQKCWHAVWQLTSQTWWGISSPSQWSRGFTVLTAGHSAPGVNMCTCQGLC